MTVLSGRSIRELNIISPFCERTVHESGLSYGVSHCGYDIRVKQDIDWRNYQDDFQLASTIEEFNMPKNVMAVVHDKSTWARQGLSVFNTVIEPGWKGFLTLELVNHGDEIIQIKAGTPVAQVVFHFVDEEVPGYQGKYQNQPDQPVEARFE